MAEVCVSCKSPVLWVLTEKGKRMPVDSEPVPGGNIVLSHRQAGQPPVAVVQTRAMLDQLVSEHDRSPEPGPLRLFVSHFASCPEAAEHRRSPAKRTDSHTERDDPFALEDDCDADD